MIYTVNAFIDKNCNLFHDSLREALLKSTNEVVVEMFSTEDITANKKSGTVSSFQEDASKIDSYDNVFARSPIIIAMISKTYTKCYKTNNHLMSGALNRTITKNQVIF